MREGGSAGASGVEPRKRVGRHVALGVGAALVMLGIAAAVLSAAAAPRDSDAAGAWGGVVPVAFVGLVGLRRHEALLAIAGAVFVLVLGSLAFELIRMNHSDAWAFVVFTALAVAEVLAMSALRRSVG